MQLKHYHPEHVRKKSGDDPLYHPKLGALYKKNLNQDQSVRWTDRHDLVDDLEEKMMNVLEWAGIPTNPGSWFVEDDHFVPGESDRRIAFWDDPTPEIEASQESVIIRTLQELEDSDRDVLEYVAMADGGTVDGAAEETGWSEATVYRRPSATQRPPRLRQSCCLVGLLEDVPTGPRNRLCHRGRRRVQRTTHRECPLCRPT
ncbi:MULTISPECIES: hypothetical protein [Haloferax]|uniref:DUF7845 domain-containing protein n=1 Tax=Haloferax TaxID=2251 RepID=UPI001CD962DB|nr:MULTISPECIES: hypothetical protein [Haloferax]